MNVVLATLVVVGFALTIEYLDLPGHARTAGQRGIASLQVIRNSSMKDREKEKALQRQARSLFGLLCILLGGSALAIAVPLAGVWALTQLGLGSFAGTLSVLERLDFLAGATAVGVLGYLFAQHFSGP